MSLRGAFVALAAFAAGCVAPSDEVGGLAALPPLDCSVLVTGGAFLVGETADGAFGAAPDAGAPAGGEAIAMAAIADELQASAVFQGLDVEPDPARRARLAAALRAGVVDDEVVAYLQGARLAGHDYLLVVEGLQDAPIEAQGTNGRWPVTFATWILLGVGAFIPDRTFETRATLRVTLRDLQSGRALHDPLLVTGPVDLSLVERTDTLGLVESIVVPPSLVGDDPAAVRAAVRGIVERRLLTSLARDLKGEALRQRLRERAAADVALAVDGGTPRVVVRSATALGSARLVVAGLDAALADGFARELLASGRVDGAGFRYEAALPPTPPGARVQALVATVGGEVASATFAPGGRP